MINVNRQRNYFWTSNELILRHKLDSEVPYYKFDRLRFSMNLKKVKQSVWCHQITPTTHQSVSSIWKIRNVFTSQTWVLSADSDIVTR